MGRRCENYLSLPQTSTFFHKELNFPGTISFAQVFSAFLILYVMIWVHGVGLIVL
jgi:hypothetical protein